MYVYILLNKFYSTIKLYLYLLTKYKHNTINFFTKIN